MDAGVGEAMAISALIGAGVGGATSAATGQDPLKGALIGGLGGAVTGGAMGAFGGAGAAAADVTGQIGTDIASMTAANASPEVISQSLQSTYGMTAEQAQAAMAQQAATGSTANGINMANAATAGAPGQVAGNALQNTTVANAGANVNAPVTSGYNIPSYEPGGSAGLPGSGLDYQGLTTTNAANQIAQSSAPTPGTFGQGFMQGLSDNAKPAAVGALGIGALAAMNSDKKKYGVPAQEHYTGPLTQFHYNPSTYKPTYPTPPNPPYTAQYAEGGITQLPQDKNFAAGGMYPMSQIDHTQYSSSPQTPMSMQATMAGYDPETNPLTGEPTTHMASGGIAGLLKGKGDGMSDSIHATIADKQPARLADGEFVVPADVVSHLGNGSTDAGAKHLYKMMDKVRQARTGTKKQGKQIAAGGYLPA
jgi:hypothetical protein